mgnify:CR=1 FL=1
MSEMGADSMEYVVIGIFIVVVFFTAPVILLLIWYLILLIIASIRSIFKGMFRKGNSGN